MEMLLDLLTSPQYQTGNVFIDILSNDMWTPLMISAQLNTSCQLMIQLLIDYGCDLNIPGPNNWTIIHMLASQGAEESLKTIVKLRPESPAFLARTDLGATPFYIASQTGHKECLPLLFAGRQSLIIGTTSGVCPLHVASVYGHKSVVQYLLEDQEMDVDFRTREGKTALHFCAEFNQLDILQYLLTNKADVDAVDQHHTTPLHLAAQVGNIESVKALLVVQANPNVSDEAGNTPLHLAAAENNVKVIYLLQDVVDFEKEVYNTNGETPLLTALIGRQSEAGLVLINAGSSVNASDKLHVSSAHACCRWDLSLLLREIINGGGKVDSVDDEGRTPLHVACMSGADACVRVLVVCDQYTNARMQPPLTYRAALDPMYAAVKEGHKPSASILAKAGFSSVALVDDTDYAGDGWNAVHVASWNGDADILKLLLLEQVETPRLSIDAVKLKITGGHSALHLAMWNGHLDAVEVLLDAGAALSITNDDDFSSLHVAAEAGFLGDVFSRFRDVIFKDVDAYNWLDEFQHCCTGYSLLHTAAQSGRVIVIEAIIDEYRRRTNKSKNVAIPLFMDIASTEAKHTALHVAIIAGKQKSVQILLKEGSNVNATTALGNTSLHLACERGEMNIVENLFDEEASQPLLLHVLARNKAGWPALHLGLYNGYSNLIQIFQRYRPNMDLDQPITNGDRLLHIAIKRNDYEAIEILMNAGADVNLEGEAGISALDLAEECKDEKSLKLLTLEKSND